MAEVFQSSGGPLDVSGEVFNIGSMESYAVGSDKHREAISAYEAEVAAAKARFDADALAQAILARLAADRPYIDIGSYGGTDGYDDPDWRELATDAADAAREFLSSNE